MTDRADLYITTYRGFDVHYSRKAGFVWEGAPEGPSAGWPSLDRVRADIDLYHKERAAWIDERDAEQDRLDAEAGKGA